MSQIEQVAGPAFPFVIDPATGQVMWAQGREKIRQNIHIVLSTRVGERPMGRNFGTRIPSLVHDINSDALAQVAIAQAREALLQFEPRILLVDAGVQHIEGEMSLRLRYAFLSEQREDELTLPLR